MTTSDNPSPTVTERGRAIEKAIKQVVEIYVKRQVRDALKQRNGLRTSETLGVLIRGEVLVYREGKG